MNKKERAEEKRIIARINNDHPGLSWVPCIVCGRMCPQSFDDPFFSQFDEVHAMCMIDDIYPKRVRELAEEREAQQRPVLF